MIIKVWVNCPSEDVADEIAEQLLERRLIGAANRYAAITSRYVWKGEIKTAREIPLLLKSRKDLFPRVADAICRFHPYEAPSILSIEIDQANDAYLDYMMENTHQG
ncbi:divalent-cation tolerance protein CutA [uncultured Roseibium sp.]|uniref:divalent-cation tolerance protein CutA n=1 Tax=uncultured Roseibium sp. TaxID=1936171 RepID=UPI002610B531|nr:divalent-cation tolerance protein CutA [uncultured Roseibium sp.]